MSDYKNQHYIPKYYFRWFSDHEKLIDVFIVPRSQFVYNAPIKSQASKSGFYGSSKAEKAVTSLENLLREPLSSMRKWAIGKHHLSPDDHINLLRSILFQRSRTQAERIKNSDASDKLIKEYFKATTSPDDPRYKLMHEHLNDVRIQFDGLTGIQIKTSFEQAGLCADLGLALLLFDEADNRILVFGDSPVVFYNHALHRVKVRGVLGFQSPGLLIFYPVSPHRCLVLFDTRFYNLPWAGIGNVVVAKGNQSDLLEINKVQMLAAYGTVYFRGQSREEQIKTTWDSIQGSYLPVQSKLNKAPGFYHGESDSFGEIVHIYEPQINYLADFSFINGPPVETESGFPGYRSPELVAAMRLQPGMADLDDPE